MELNQDACDGSKRKVKKVSVVNLVMGFALLLITGALVFLITRQFQLERMFQLEKDDLAPGAIYTRWGRTTCPAKSAKLVYKGVTGGQNYNQAGGGSTILCLPLDPSTSNFSTAFSDANFIYVGEYEAKDGIFFDVPCAVCQTLTTATIMMLPARRMCYSGWTLEYSGFLMSAYMNHRGRIPFTCMDAAAEGDPASGKDDNSVVFYPVQGQCGSLPCPPYTPKIDLTCAVCSQSA